MEIVRKMSLKRMLSSDEKKTKRSQSISPQEATYNFTTFLEYATKNLPDMGEKLDRIKKHAETVLKTEVTMSKASKKNDEDEINSADSKADSDFSIAKASLEKFLVYAKDKMDVEKIADYTSLLHKMEGNLNQTKNA